MIIIQSEHVKFPQYKIWIYVSLFKQKCIYKETARFSSNQIVFLTSRGTKTCDFKMKFFSVTVLAVLCCAVVGSQSNWWFFCYWSIFLQSFCESLKIEIHSINQKNVIIYSLSIIYFFTVGIRWPISIRGCGWITGICAMCGWYFEWIGQRT